MTSLLSLAGAQDKTDEYANQALFRPWSEYIDIVGRIFHHVKDPDEAATLAVASIARRSSLLSGGDPPPPRSGDSNGSGSARSAGAASGEEGGVTLGGGTAPGPNPFVGASVMDLGCGVGAVSRIFASRGAGRVLSVDVDAQMLDRAKRDTKPDLPIYYLLQDVTSPAFDTMGERFDIVWSSYVIAYVDDMKGVLRSWMRFLKPATGILVVVEVDGLLGNHTPLENGEWFDQFDRLGIPRYNVYAGGQMKDVAEQLQRDGELSILAYNELIDPELAFQGPLSPDSLPYRGWQARMARLAPLLLEFEFQHNVQVVQSRIDEFLACLRHPNHKCKRKVKMLVVRPPTRNVPRTPRGGDGERSNAVGGGESVFSTGNNPSTMPSKKKNKYDADRESESEKGDGAGDDAS